MRLLLIFSLLCIIPLITVAQLQDDFSDGDFTSNPTWSGDDAQFKINSSNKLQLNSSGSDTSCLSTSNSLINNTEWRFYIKQSFNSSSNNHSRIYLVSDQSQLKNNINGYYIQFGSTQDDICLYRQDGNSTVKIISGTYGNTGNSVNEFTIKVTRDGNGLWELFSDDQAGSNFHSEGTVIDLTYQSTSWFGVWCKYTSSNSTKIYLDDFYVGPIVVDTIPPKLIQAKITASNMLDLYFNEELDSASASTMSNYFVTNAIGSPSLSQVDANIKSIVHLSFWNPFPQGQPCILTASNIKDLAGNLAPPQSITFAAYDAVQYDILINEIMADPSPKIGLPEWEYIELYNKTNLPISLDHWILKIGNTEKTLPDSVVPPNGFVIIAHENAALDLSSFGIFIGLSSFSLTNSGQQLVLLDDKRSLMHQVNYLDSWYQDNNKEDGGWSLEQIDVENPCGCANNWNASNDIKGGTPGSINSVKSVNPDQTKPTILRISVLDTMSIQLFFSEPMDSSSLFNKQDYEVTDFGFPIELESNYPIYNSVILKFGKPFKTQVMYYLAVDGHLEDCVGNQLVPNAKYLINFGLPEVPDSNDVVINEILFNPQTGGVDYVEIYNKSEKIIDLKLLRLANWSYEDQNYENIKELAPSGYLIYPRSYYVFSTNSTLVQKQYYVMNPKNLIEIPSMISMANTSGNVYLLTSWFKLIDGIEYDEDMQYALIQNPKGISLERINYNYSSNDPRNWHSAATTGDRYSQSSDYAGTPTYENSQFTLGNEFDGDVWINQEIFSPDNDGYYDVLNIQYKFDEPGYTANIIVYDSNGKLIRNLVSNELVSMDGVVIWDGLDNENQKANIGIYIIYVEVFNLNGDVKRFKLKAVVGGFL